MSTRPLHRGSSGDMAVFAAEFIRARMRGFEKDMRVCLTTVPRPDGTEGVTCAWFPGLATCCSMLEYLTALHEGRLKGIAHGDVFRFAHKYLPQPAYDAEAVRILFDAFRNTVNHRGIATGVWIDRNFQNQGRRLVWKLLKSEHPPAIELVAEHGQLSRDSPWPCHYTHRVHIKLGRLWRDIKASSEAYIADITPHGALEHNFRACMRKLYPE